MARSTTRYSLPAMALFTALATFAISATVSGCGGDSSRSSVGLPNTPDYHSLLVDPANPELLTLGTHNGLFVSDNGGRRWRFDSLADDDAMNLARPRGSTIWLAGHNVFKKSSDGGETWTDVRPSGLPGLDIHGFTVDPRNPRVLYAALAGEGLYRSQDGGRSFALASDRVGGSVMGMVVLPNGRILASDMQLGIVASGDAGRTWQLVLPVPALGLAANPADSSRILATGSGIALSTDGGGTWRPVLELPEGAGPVAWSKSDPTRAYVVGFDRKLYRSTDRGEHWQAVDEEG